MSTQTTNYELFKPELSDVSDITAMNQNWDKIDEELYKKADQTKVDEKADKLVVNQLSNPNLLINGDFQVNQRGKTVYGSNGWGNKVYSVDRWCIIGGGAERTKVTVNDSGTITLSSEVESGTLYQFLEEQLKENYYTITVKILSLNGYGQVYLENDMFELSVGINTFTRYGTLSQIRLLIGEDSSMEVEYVKLEQGSIATPFVPRTYVEELAMCERYAKWINVQSAILYNYGTSFMVMVEYPEMRSTPTLTYCNGHTWNSSGAGMTSTSFEHQQSNSRYTKVKLFFSESIRSGVCGFHIDGFADAEIY